jgi:hypothetical protein
MPLLKALTIEDKDTMNSFSCADAPNLYKFYGFESHFNLDDIPRHIRVLEFRRCSLFHCYDSTSPLQFPNLLDIVWYGVNIEDVGCAGILAPKLETLIIYTSREAINASSLLEAVCIDGVPFGSNLLENLRLENVVLTIDVLPYLRRLHSLRRLILYRRMMEEGILLKIWTSSDSSTSFLPLLQKIEIMTSTRNDWEELGEFQRYCAIHRPLLEVKVIETNKID